MRAQVVESIEMKKPDFAKNVSSRPSMEGALNARVDDSDQPAEEVE